MPTVIKQSKLARLTLKGKKVDEGSFRAMNAFRNNLIREGYPAYNLHVGYAVHKGVFYCKHCEAQTTDPHNDWYEGHEYWICTCGKINYIN